jgi:hypothetical protein
MFARTFGEAPTENEEIEVSESAQEHEMLYICGAGLADSNGEYHEKGLKNEAPFFMKGTKHENEHMYLIHLNQEAGDENKLWYISEVKSETRYQHYYKATGVAKHPTEASFAVAGGEQGPTYIPAPSTIQKEPCRLVA